MLKNVAENAAASFDTAPESVPTHCSTVTAVLRPAFAPLKDTFSRTLDCETHSPHGVAEPERAAATDAAIERPKFEPTTVMVAEAVAAKLLITTEHSAGLSVEKDALSVEMWPRSTDTACRLLVRVPLGSFEMTDDSATHSVAAHDDPLTRPEGDVTALPKPSPIAVTLIAEVATAFVLTELLT